MADQCRGLRPNAVAALVLVALGAGLLLWQRPWQSADDGRVPIPADARAVLSSQFRTLGVADTEAEFVAAAGSTSTAQTFARDAWAARAALGAGSVQLRYLRGGEAPDTADGSTEVTVEVGWRPGGRSGLTESARTSAVVFRVDPQRDGTFAIRSVRSGDGALPIWLAGNIGVQRVSGAVVIRVDGGDDALPVESMATAARAAVERVVPDTKGAVTLVSPRSQGQMAQLVGQGVDRVRQIAAVTTKLDGRSGTSAGTVIVLNPAVFATMDRRAAQVVMTHEATHLLTGAAGSTADSWVVEGFADFVALRDDTAPLSVSAGQVLAQVRAGTTPDRLPSAADFESTRHQLGAVYESAWMIFRFLGESRDDQDLVAFYESVLDGTPIDSALQSAFGLGTKQLTAGWQDYLTKSASTVS